MAVYVDPLLACVPHARWRWHESCHLMADTLAELHRFAGQLGLLRSWFQESQTRAGWVPHYDLNASKRIVAVRNGAVPLDRKATVQIFQRWREATRRRDDADTILDLEPAQ